VSPTAPLQSISRGSDSKSAHAAPVSTIWVEIAAVEMRRTQGVCM
jgi:hypothetical protein